MGRGQGLRVEAPATEEQGALAAFSHIIRPTTPPSLRLITASSIPHSFVFLCLSIHPFIHTFIPCLPLSSLLFFLLLLRLFHFPFLQFLSLTLS